MNFVILMCTRDFYAFYKTMYALFMLYYTFLASNALNLIHPDIISDALWTAIRTTGKYCLKIKTVCG